MKTGRVALTIALQALAFAQTAPQASLLERARKGDKLALSQMEESGDVRDLRSLLHDPNYAGKISVRLSLSRMGDREALQYFACGSLAKDMSQIDDLMRQDLDHVGGDFTIEVYRHLLDSDPRFLPQIQRIMEQMKERGGDAFPTLPSVSAIYKLSKLVPDSSIPELKPLDIQAHPGIEEEFKSKWRTWIDSHQLELQKLKPTAKEIHFDSSYCSEFKDTTRH